MTKSYTLLVIVAGTIVGLLVLFLIPTHAHAHGAGLTLTSTTTDYMVDVDYDAFSIVAGDPGRFDFKLFKDAGRTKPVDFTQVWVRISRKDGDDSDTLFDTVFSGWIAKATFGSTGMTIALPDSGAYDMLVRYNNGDNAIIETTLPFTVDPNEKDNAVLGPEFWAGGAAAALLIAVIVGIAQYIRITRRRP